MARGVVIVALVLPFVVQGAARADDVFVTVTTLKAQSSGSTDPTLRRIRSQLRRVAGYRAYRIVEADRRGCQWARRQHFRLPGGRSLHLTPRGISGDRVNMQVRILEGTEQLVETDVRMKRNGTMFFGLERGMRAQDGAIVIMVRAGEAGETGEE